MGYILSFLFVDSGTFEGRWKAKFSSALSFLSFRLCAKTLVFITFL